MAGEEPMTVRKIVSLPSQLWEAIENYRFEHRFKSEADAIRELIRRGLEASPKPEKPKKR